MEVNVVVVCLKIDVTNNEKMYGMNNKSSSAFRKFGLNIILSSNNSEIFSPLNAELNPPCYLLALLAHYFLHVSRIRVTSLTLRLLMPYIYIYICVCVCIYIYVYIHIYVCVCVCIYIYI